MAFQSLRNPVCSCVVSLVPLHAPLAQGISNFWKISLFGGRISRCIFLVAFVLFLMVLRAKNFVFPLLGRCSPGSPLWIHCGCLVIHPHKPITRTPKALITEGHYKIADPPHYFCLPLTVWSINQYSYNVAVFLVMASCTCFSLIISIVAELCGRLPIILPQCAVPDEAGYCNAMLTCIINSSLYVCFGHVKEKPLLHMFYYAVNLKVQLSH